MTASGTARVAMVAFAVAGALLFGVGLLTGAWFYVVHLHPRPGAPLMTTGVAAWNLLLFTIFASHHSIMARSGVKLWLARLLPPCLERSVYVWVASLLFIATCLAWQPTRGVAWRLDGVLAWMGAGLQLAGLVVTALGARFLDIWELAGVRQVLGAGTMPVAGYAARESRPLDTITTRGPFGLVRHPIYLGWVLLVWSAPFMTSGRLLFATASTVYLVLAIPLEERSLLHHYGEQYREYQRKTRFRLLPGVW